MKGILSFRELILIRFKPQAPRTKHTSSKQLFEIADLSLGACSLKLISYCFCILSMIPVVEKPSTIGTIFTSPPLANTSLAPAICSTV